MSDSENSLEETGSQISPWRPYCTTPNDWTVNVHLDMCQHSVLISDLSAYYTLSLCIISNLGVCPASLISLGIFCFWWYLLDMLRQVGLSQISSKDIPLIIEGERKHISKSQIQFYSLDFVKQVEFQWVSARIIIITTAYLCQMCLNLTKCAS